MSRKLLWGYAAILLAAAILRGAAVWGGCQEISRLYRPDSAGYLIPARALAEHGSYPTTRRPPGFPVLAALVYRCGGGDKLLSAVLAVTGVAAVAVVGWAGHLAGGPAAGLIAASLYALHPTAIGNAPLLLSDVWAGLFAALQFAFFLKFRRQGRVPDFFLCAAAAAVGTLIRPINQLWILPLLVLLACMPDVPRRRKWALGATGAALFCLLIFPWMARNAAQGAGFCIDTNTGAMYHQNGAMLSGEVTGRGYEAEKRRLLAEQEQEFRDTVRYPDEKSREAYRISRYRQLVLVHFPVWLRQQCNWQILLPDLPSLLEDFGVTGSDRGTLAVLKEQGLMTAVRHYFGTHWLGIILASLPLLLVHLLVCCGAGVKLLGDLVHWKKKWYDLLIFLAFVEYYLFLPGAITAPRYQIPALPCLCVFAALTLCRLLRREVHHAPAEVQNRIAAH